MQIEEFFVRALISLGIGALIGVEREFSKKQTLVGIRTLALSSLLGMLSSYFEFPFLIPIGFIIVASYGLLFYTHQKRRVVGLTTLFSLLLSYIFGILVGFGYIIEAVGITIITTLLLFMRAETRIFVRKLKREEILEALEFGIILFILYPILPESVSFFGFTLNLKMALQIIIIISLISLLTFFVLVFYGEYMLPIVGLIGGMINSFGTITNFVDKKKVETSSILLAEAGKMVSAILLSFLIIGFHIKLFFGCVVMGIVLLIFAILNHKKLPYKKLRLHQPFSLKEGIKIGFYTLVAFLLSQLFSNSQYGLYLTSLLIGIFSTNAIIATSALGLSNKSITVPEASTMIFLSLLSGLVVDALLTRKTKVFKKVSMFTLLAILFGMLAFLLIGA
jgi:uncharacterized membrane protein (DUF4010 family)